MNNEQETAMRECLPPGRSLERSRSREIIGRLAGQGVERYHADYSRQENDVLPRER